MKVFCAVAVLLALHCLSGCRAVGTGAPVVDSPVCLAEGYSLERAVFAAADRRRWSVEKMSDKVFRLTIRQRSNLCCVDVTIGDGCFSIIPVASTITIAKYDQWVGNLEREIRMRANRGR